MFVAACNAGAVPGGSAGEGKLTMNKNFGIMLFPIKLAKRQEILGGEQSGAGPADFTVYAKTEQFQVNLEPEAQQRKEPWCVATMADSNASRISEWVSSMFGQFKTTIVSFKVSSCFTT